MGENQFFYWEGEDLILRVHVQPRASKTEVSGFYGDAIKIRIKAPPIDGKANVELTRFLASLFKVHRASVELVTGDGSREKRFRVRKPLVSPEEIIKP